VRHF